MTEKEKNELIKEIFDNVKTLNMIEQDMIEEIINRFYMLNEEKENVNT